MSLIYVSDNQFTRERTNIFKTYFDNPQFHKCTIFTINDIEGHKQIFPFVLTMHNYLYCKKRLFVDQIIRESVLYEYLNKVLKIENDQVNKDILMKNAFPFLFNWLEDFELFYRALPLENKEKIGYATYMTMAPFLSRCKHCFKEFNQVLPPDNLCKESINKKKCRSAYYKDFVSLHIKKVYLLKKKLEEFCEELKLPGKEKKSSSEIKNKIDSLHQDIIDLADIFFRKVMREPFYLEIIKEDFVPIAKTPWLFLKSKDNRLVILTNQEHPKRSYPHKEDKNSKKKNKKEKEEQIPLYRKIANSPGGGGIREIAQRFPNQNFKYDSNEMTGMVFKTVPYDQMKILQSFLDNPKEFKNGKNISIRQEEYKKFLKLIEELNSLFGLDIKLNVVKES